MVVSLHMENKNLIIINITHIFDVQDNTPTILDETSRKVAGLQRSVARATWLSQSLV